MGKGYKRKTRWRTLNIADCPSAPPGDKDDEDGIRKTRDNNTRRNGQGTRKSSEHSRNEQKDENSVAAGESVRSSAPSRSQAKFIFDENEYTRITTPRQDVLFKKGYLGRKKAWTGNNASTSVTPSTTESQSASHSTADGSEITEDQQLFDYRDNGIESYPSPSESVAQMSYGTFYDHASGYYYEYPMMLMGPPMPGPPMHNVLAAMPCQAVPLRPIEWVNPAFVPKLDQQYCLVDYQNSQTDQQYPMIVDENEIVVSTRQTNGIEETIENGNGGSSWGESVTSEEQPSNDDDHHSQHDKEESVEIQDNENCEATVMNSDFPNELQLETLPAQQLQVSHHVLPPVPQPYMYPGHYMFGPALVNVNGLTIQSGQMIRMTGMNITASAYARTKKKKKMRHRKMRRFNGPDNLEGYGPEEEDYSSEAENAKTRASLNDVNTFVSNDTTTSRPLNPNCKEFEFKTTNVESLNVTSHGDAITTPTTSHTVENVTKESRSSETTILLNHKESSCKSSSIHDVDESPTESSAIVTSIEYAAEAISNEPHHTNGFCEIQETEIGVDVTCAEFDDIVGKLGEKCAKLTFQNNSSDLINVAECDRLSNGTNESRDKIETQRLTNHENLSKSYAAKNKYNGSINTNGEVLPGFKLDENPCTSKTDAETHIHGVPMGIDAIQAQLSVDTSNEDSGFESQTRFSDHPITDAVTQWLRRANSPELFIKTMVDGRGVAETDMEDDELDDGELSKNLQGNPIPALSANSIVNDVETMSSRTTSSGEFARVSNCSQGDVMTTIRKKKKRSGNCKKRMSKSVDRVAAIDNKMRSKNKSNRRQQRKKNHTTSKIQEKSPMEQQDDACEFMIKDSDVGMRVAINTRINLNEVQSRTNIVIDKRLNESSRDMSTGRIEVDMDKVKTFEQGEIVVSIDGKLLPTTIYGQIKSLSEDNTIFEDQLVNVSERNSIGSIEEPDMLECWEAETIESINPKLFINDRELHKSDEIDDITYTKVDTTGLELVRKYYTLARGSVQSFSSVEDGVSDANQLDLEAESKLIIPQRIIETLCGEKISSNNDSKDMLYKKLPIDNGIEVYESCYTGRKPPIFISTNFHKSHSLHDEEGPIPCKATCCMIQ